MAWTQPVLRLIPAEKIVWQKNKKQTVVWWCHHHRAGALCCGVVFENDASSAAFLNELCSQVLKKQDGIPPDRSLSLCHHELMNKCGIDLEDVVKSDVDGAVVDRRLSSKFHGRVRAQNLTSCLEINFGIDENLVRAKKSYHRPSDVLYPRKPGSSFPPCQSAPFQSITSYKWRI